MLEDLRTLEERLTSRLAELQPLVEEYEDLKRLAERLDVDITPAAKSKTAPRAKPDPAPRIPSPRRKTAERSRRGNPSRTRPGGTRATGEERRELVLTLIRDRPGVTVRELSKETGVDAPSLYRVVRRLQQSGDITKDGKALRPA